jgi:hypothetical protein
LWRWWFEEGGGGGGCPCEAPDSPVL